MTSNEQSTSGVDHEGEERIGYCPSCKEELDEVDIIMQGERRGRHATCWSTVFVSPAVAVTLANPNRVSL